MNEKITQKKIISFYEQTEDPLYLDEQPAREATFSDYLDKLEKFYPQKGKLLDVGTNTGLFVYLAKKKGWESLGLEPNRWGVDYAKASYGLSLINKAFGPRLYPKNSFGVITMWDVIEHFMDPVDKIKNVYSYLAPGGLFAFSTVDPESLVAELMGTNWPWYMEMHRVLFSQKAIKNYLEKVGFSRVFFKPHFRKLSLGYLATRLVAVHPLLASSVSKAVKVLGLEKVIVPYFGSDLYDCYAFK